MSNMFTNLAAVLYALFLFSDSALSAFHPAKRQFESIQDVCGTSPVDCGNGWCCFVGQECIEPANSDSEPLCRDNVLTDLGGPVSLLLSLSPLQP
ncbi:hypothetical protein P154DRAFT_112164 [Amniculicola lignicola CBS 123094]|uniref:Uncharacterized protein n=1 Tax=Amniculicola lignicola CBS 123094 TaxID=1392246 RepID=A0A6A5WVP0_9PLEO|nr:hypothetical protein P154DRAFT_112164 [Amniculicola lignicola CBS 123094]